MLALNVLPESGQVSPSGRSLRGSHQLAAFEVCERIGDFRYIRGIVPKADKLWRSRGSLIHLSLAYWRANQMDPRPSWFYEKSLSDALEEKGAGDPPGIRNAIDIISAYEKAHSDTLPWTPLYVEHEFVTTIGQLDPGIHAELKVAKAAVLTPELRAQIARLELLAAIDSEVVSCRPDLVFRVSSDNWINDYKTHSKPWGKNKGLRAWKKDGEYTLDWQVLINLHVVRQFMPIRGFIIDRMTREPDSNKRFHFDRHPLDIPALAYSNAPRRARTAIIRELAVREKIKNGIMPDPSYWACQGRFGACDQRPVCAARDREEAYKIIKDDFRQEVVHSATTWDAEEEDL